MQDCLRFGLIRRKVGCIRARRQRGYSRPAAV